MKTAIDCIPCFIQQALSSARFVTNEIDVHEKVMRHILQMISQIDYATSPPEMAQLIHQAIREITGHADPYQELKAFSNQLARKIYPDLQEKVRQHREPFKATVRIAIAGNIIDFARHHDLTEHTIIQTLDRAFNQHICPDSLHYFYQETNQADRILYLGDNAGEIVFDKLLIEQIGCEKIVYAVRGSAILNDATISDAEFAGITNMVRVIDNGTDAPGTILEQCSEEFRYEFDHADLIISKGQGNFETLNDVDQNIFFLFKVKCPVVSNITGYGLGELLIHHHTFSRN